jgi:hypothetical protein
MSVKQVDTFNSLNDENEDQQKEYIYIDGRRYINRPDCPYVLPNDLAEMNR